MCPKAAGGVSMLVPSIINAEFQALLKCRLSLQSPAFSRSQLKNRPLDSTKTPIINAEFQALLKCRLSLQSPAFSRSQLKNRPLDSTKTLKFNAVDVCDICATGG